MDDSETKDEKVGENNDVLDVDSLDSFPSLPTTGSQKSADDVEKENKQKNTCVGAHDDGLAKGRSAVPAGELNAAGVNQLKVDTPVDTDGVKGEQPSLTCVRVTSRTVTTQSAALPTRMCRSQRTTMMLVLLRQCRRPAASGSSRRVRISSGRSR